MEQVYVGNLPEDISIRDIDDFFRPFGKLVYIDVHNRSNPVFAYIQFDNPCDAYNAVRARSGYDYEGYTLQVKLVEKSNDRYFEVRNQCQEESPPPPPMFNDFHNQSNHCEFGENVFMNPSLLQSKLPSEDMIQHRSSRHSNVSLQNNLAYPTPSRWSGISNNDVPNCSFDGFNHTNDNSDRGGNNAIHSSGGFNMFGGDYDDRDFQQDFSNNYPQNFNMARRSLSMSRKSRNILNGEEQPEAREEMTVLEKKLIKMDNFNIQNNIKENKKIVESNLMTSVNEIQDTVTAAENFNEGKKQLMFQSAESDNADVIYVKPKRKRKRKRKSIRETWKSRYSWAIHILDKIAKNTLNGTVHERDAEDRVKFQAVLDEYLQYKEAKRNLSQSNGNKPPKRKK